MWYTVGLGQQSGFHDHPKSRRSTAGWNMAAKFKKKFPQLTLCAFQVVADRCQLLVDCHVDQVEAFLRGLLSPFSTDYLIYLDVLQHQPDYCPSPQLKLGHGACSGKGAYQASIEGV